MVANFELLPIMDGLPKTGVAVSLVAGLDAKADTGAAGLTANADIGLDSAAFVALRNGESAGGAPKAPKPSAGLKPVLDAFKLPKAPPSDCAVALLLKGDESEATGAGAGAGAVAMLLSVLRVDDEVFAAPPPKTLVPAANGAPPPKIDLVFSPSAFEFSVEPHAGAKAGVGVAVGEPKAFKPPCANAEKGSLVGF